MEEPIFSVSDFVAVFNQTISYAYQSTIVEGELDNFRISKNRWVYFDLKDDLAKLSFFANVTQLPGPLENGMMLRVRGVPVLHSQYGFSVNVQFMQPIGEGSLKRAADLLESKLRSEGLFDPSRKRQILYPPTTIGLITSTESAAYHDFIKIINNRWSGININVVDVRVQGESAPAQIISAIDYLNTQDHPVDVIVLIRGGGSSDDLAVFSSELVTRSVATSRIPTLVAIGHEIDFSLTELAADIRGSTPSNAAEILVPDKKDVLRDLITKQKLMVDLLQNRLTNKQKELVSYSNDIHQIWDRYVQKEKNELSSQKKMLDILSPVNVLNRGYAILRKNGIIISSGSDVSVDDSITIELRDAVIETSVTGVKGN